MAVMYRNVSFMFQPFNLRAFTPAASIFLLVGIEVLALFRLICRYYFGFVLIF